MAPSHKSTNPKWQTFIIKSDKPKCRYWFNNLITKRSRLSATPGGYFQIRRSGGLRPHINFGGKIWGKVRPSSPNKRKNLGSSVTTRNKSGEKSQFWCHICNSEGKIWGSNKNFKGKFWGQAPLLDLLIWKYPPGSATCVSFYHSKSSSIRYISKFLVRKSWQIFHKIESFTANCKLQC